MSDPHSSFTPPLAAVIHKCEEGFTRAVTFSAPTAHKRCTNGVCSSISCLLLPHGYGIMTQLWFRSRTAFRTSPPLSGVPLENTISHYHCLSAPPPACSDARDSDTDPPCSSSSAAPPCSRGVPLLPRMGFSQMGVPSYWGFLCLLPSDLVRSLLHIHIIFLQYIVINFLFYYNLFLISYYA